MSNPLQSVHVKRFKGISDAPFDTAPINVFIGANNSGKSTLAQIIHFCIGLLQSINLAGRWGSGPTVSLSLSPGQLLYSPCIDLYALGENGQLLERQEKAIETSLVLQNGQQVDIIIRKGRNGNIHTTVNNVGEARNLASLENPYTIYSPGLAGIARNEMYISNGVLVRTIARGDANLVFRNILLRLHEQNGQWDAFMGDLCEIFPNIQIRVDYISETAEYINVFANNGTAEVPIELAGTGVLQAVQILAYVHYFHPSVIILDEPDSHLHPNNQRLLCKLLQRVAEERCTQVFLTTHSRHVVDALGGQANFLWVRSGTVEKIQQDHDLAVLLDIGALDVKEMLSQSAAKCIVLTEDAIKRGLEVLLSSSGFDMSKTLVLAYYGCTTPHNLRPLLDLIRGSNQNATIVVHRDRDYLTVAECNQWEADIRKMNAEPFLTVGVDIESHFLNPKHLASINSLSDENAKDILDQATVNMRDQSIEKLINSRTDIEKKLGTFGKLNLGKLALEAPKQHDENPRRYRFAKSVLREMRRIHQENTGENLRVIESSTEVSNDTLAMIAKKTF